MRRDVPRLVIDKELDPTTASTFSAFVAATASMLGFRRIPHEWTSANALPRLGAHILVVDDDPLVLRATTRLLQHHHRIEATTRAAEALRRLRDGETFDVILCDLQMPEMTGMSLYETVLEFAPHMADRMVFFTGGAFTERACAFVAANKHRTVDKPFDRATLLSVIGEVVEAFP